MFFHNFLSNNLFYLFSKLTLILKNNFMLFFLKNFICLIIYSLNLALCLHLAISSFLLFNIFFGSGKSKTSNPKILLQIIDSFETDLFKLIKMVKFKEVYNNFQMKSSKDIKEVKSSNYIWVRSDKSKKYI